MRIIAATALAAFLLVSAGQAQAETITLAGDVTYRERISLPDGGSLTVSLIDLAMPDRPRVTVAAGIGGPGQVPIAFDLDLDKSIILPEHDYALEATISDANGAIWFTTPEPYSVAPLDQVDPIEIILHRVAVDAARMSNKATEALELPLMNFTWQVSTIGGQPIRRGVLSSLSIDSEKRAGGRGGCNSWFAQADVDSERLVFSTLAATRTDCVSDARSSQEDSFFSALTATRKWVIDFDDNLVLLNDDGGELMRFVKSRL